MRILPFTICAILTTGLVVALNSKLGTVPPLGKMLSPSHGLWQNAEAADADFSLDIQSPYLKAPVEVYLDDRLVPHVFAQNDPDAYFAQGYLHAKFRLWQMQFQVLAAGGRLCEVLGEKVGDNSVLEKHDRKFRRMGMMLAAENSVKAMNEVPEDKAAMEAYAAGVNHYIHQLSPAQYPIEFKLLDYAPEEWTPFHSALFLKYMSYDLASDLDDFAMTNLRDHLGKEMFGKAFPAQADSLDPISPKGTMYNVQSPLPVKPANVDSLETAEPTGIAYEVDKPDPDNGSNNWVVGGSRTASGRPILCNDPHLGLNLPSLWFEIQLVTPEYNTYGVSFPGAPSVVIGFNDSIAWGVTNAMRDVMDFYEVKFRDSSMNEYLYNGEWVKTEWRTETIRIRGKADYIDKIPLTVWGPVMYDGTFQSELKNGKAYAIRWKAIDNSLELGAFKGLNRAKNYEDYLAAIRLFKCPGQNFVFASKTDTIAWWQQAKFPAKWRGQGDFVMPGWDSTFRWQGIIADDDNVHMKNPARGFVSSANQLPADSAYPFYLGGVHDVYRGVIINRLLGAKTGVTVDSMKQMQTDNYNIFAEMARTVLLNNVQENELSSAAKLLLDDYRRWNMRADANEKGMTIFYTWWNNFADTVWTDNITRKDGLPVPFPHDNTLLEGIIRDSAFVFVDNINTSAIETLPQMLTAALNKTAEDLKTAKDLSWSGYRNVRISHLLSGLPGFSRMHLPIGGGAKIINATKETHGPSWRVIVHMTDKTEAWGVYPGGQSGNPGSKYYDQFVDQWAKGEYNALWLMTANDKQSPKAKWKITFSKS
ncbi:MAG: penicillin acylase family protein [Chitinophagaceae bacterium]|nr:penicillin acylase family protein [Chitinophagaceae bacterium]